jgi:hypothetical protein
VSRNLKTAPNLLPSAVLFLGVSASVFAAGEDPWNLTAFGLLKEAHTAFAAQPASDREARFGEAVTLINLQPKTDPNLDRAAVLLSAIASANATDDLGLSARYYLARIPQSHRATPDTAAALVIFRELASLDSPHPLAQRAVVQVALLELFEPRVPAADVRARFDRLAVRGATLTDPSAVRDFNMVMADAALRFKYDDSLALDHLLAADRAGIARAATRRDTWLRIAELARRSGRHDVSKTYYTRFLENFPRDARRLLVQERLSASDQ